MVSNAITKASWLQKIFIPQTDLKGVKIITFTATKRAITQSILQYIHVTPITGSGILSGF